jgi:KipI family sensor histidine kinase inhibitor
MSGPLVSVRSYGVETLLVELDSAARATAMRIGLDADPPPGMVETMPGLHSVLVRFDPAVADVHVLARQLADFDFSNVKVASEPTAALVQIRVDYSGADLDEVARHTGLTTREVVDRHRAATYRVALIGMAPGFYFLTGGDPKLQVPRRESPRQAVPRGSVGLAGEFTGIYPKHGPGGWQLVGRVLDELWHPTGLPAALLAPGTTVRFTSA